MVIDLPKQPREVFYEKCVLIPVKAPLPESFFNNNEIFLAWKK